jgi:hypothetical protein
MEYQVVWGGDPEDVLITTSGDASVDDLHASIVATLADPRFRKDMRVLMDHTQTRWWALSNDEIRRRAALIRADAAKVGRQRVAFVVGSPVDLGIGNMLQGLVEGVVLFECAVFETLPEGRAWLRVNQWPDQPAAD